MTRSNLYIKLTDGEYITCVADSSGAPEQGFIIENLIQPLLALNDAEKERDFLNEQCAMYELRTNATYCYTINLQSKTVSFFYEKYNFKTGKFSKGRNLTPRYTTYLKTIKQDNNNR